MDNKLEELYDKMEDIVYDSTDNSLPNSKFYRDKILSLIEEYASEKAVKFSNWQLEAECMYSATDENQWTHSETKENITTQELYHIFTNTLNSK